MEQKLIDVVRKIKEHDVVMHNYIDTIPDDIGSAFFDNTYTNAQSLQRDILIEALFGDMHTDVEWFLYEFTAGRTPGPHCVLEDGTEFTYNTNEDYYEYLRVHG